MVEFVADTEHAVPIPVEDVHLQGFLHVPSAVRGIVIFVHGSGSGRLSPRNQYVARMLQQKKFATLLFDLLTQKEDKIDTQNSQYRFDIDFLTERLIAATHWMIQHDELNKLPIGYFGASTGGAAALMAAARLAMLIKAVVSRGGRPDLAGESLTYVEAPTLLIVGGDDEEVIELNKQAYAQMHYEKKIEIVPGATHLFEEPGKLEIVAHLATEWFDKYLI